MKWTNYHTHCFYDDGNGQMEEYVMQAIERGMSALGFSCHAPVSIPSEWHLDAKDFPAYLQTIQDLKETYGNQIELYTGLEVDYIPNLIGPSTYASQLELTVGSVHYIGQLPSGEYITIDYIRERFDLALEQIFKGDIQAMVRQYYALVQEMIETDPPDIIGHLDLIKKLNKGDHYFAETMPWYQEIVRHLLPIIAASNCIMEINTKGFYRGKTEEFYPSKWILEEANALNIPVTISADAHYPQDVNNCFEKVKDLLDEIGYEEVYGYLNKKWEKI